MLLTAIALSENEGAAAWNVAEFSVNRTNLLVGKNATGKSRTLGFITALAQLLCARRSLPLVYGKIAAIFSHEKSTWKYTIEYKNGWILHEEFSRDRDVLMSRGEDGKGKIWAQKEEKMLDFQGSSSSAITARCDSIQHPYLSPLQEWGVSCLTYRFNDSASLGKNNFLVLGPQEPVANVHATEQLGGLFVAAQKQNASFEKAVIADMAKVGYEVSKIFVGAPKSIRGPIGAPPIGALCVQESGVVDYVDQMAMSDGMFRTLAILIYANYARQMGRPLTLLIDDIGEGLDFERSCQLIKVLQEKTLEFPFQLIMATNDRFVMNALPLEYWQVLRRTGSNVQVVNYTNAKEVFERFKFTGLNNFDFFATEFFCNPEVPL